MSLVSKPVRPRGRPPEYVTDREGRPIVGLSRMPEFVPRTQNGKTYRTTDGRYYATGTHPRTYFGSDYDLAVLRFRAWQDRERGSKVKFVHNVPVSPGSAEFLGKVMGYRPGLREQGKRIQETKRLTMDETLPEDVFWAKVREILSDNKGRRLAAQRTGIRELEWLFDLTPPPPAMSLDDIGKRYSEKKPPLSRDEKKQSRQFWKQFIEIVGATSIDDLKQEHIDCYKDRVFALQGEKGLVDGYVSRRFTKVKTIFAWVDKVNVCPAQSKRVLGLLTVLISPSKGKALPTPIGRADFMKLLSTADVEEKTMLLLGLNCAFYPVDIRLLTKKNGLDLERGVYAGYRHKTEIPQCAVLWKRTVTAVREHFSQNPNESEYLFVSSTGRPYAAETFRKRFAALRETAKIAKSVTFDQLRDGAASHANAEQRQVDVLLGHKSAGLTDNYVLRHPQIVKDACRNVERYYFGGR